MAYSEKVIDHYENPRNVGSLDKNDDSVGTGLVGAPDTTKCIQIYTSSKIKNIHININI